MMRLTKPSVLQVDGLALDVGGFDPAALGAHDLGVDAREGEAALLEGHVGPERSTITGLTSVSASPGSPVGFRIRRRWRRPTCGAARPTPLAAVMHSNMASTIERSSAPKRSTRGQGRRRSGFG
jgi:hypothetical protein